MIQLAALKMLGNKYVIAGVLGVALLAGSYYKGYQSANNKWKVDAAEQVKAAVLETNKQMKIAQDKDLGTIKKLRNNRDYYKNLYKGAVSFQPTADCELTDELFTQFNSAFDKADVSK